MRNTYRIVFLSLALVVAIFPSADGRKRMKDTDVAKALEGYFTLAHRETQAKGCFNGDRKNMSSSAVSREYCLSLIVR